MSRRSCARRPAEPASLSLLDGELLEDLVGIDPTFDMWLTAERERLRDRARGVAEALLREQIDPALIIPAAHRLLQIDRAHEGAWRALMRAHAEQGERGMAIQAYDRCRAVLADLLDAAPSAETQTLADRNSRPVEHATARAPPRHRAGTAAQSRLADCRVTKPPTTSGPHQGGHDCHAAARMSAFCRCDASDCPRKILISGQASPMKSPRRCRGFAGCSWFPRVR